MVTKKTTSKTLAVDELVGKPEEQVAEEKKSEVEQEYQVTAKDEQSKTSSTESTHCSDSYSASDQV